MFFKKQPKTAYLVGQFQRFVEIIQKQTLERHTKATSRDMLHECIFVFTYLTAVCNNVLKMKKNAVIEFVASATEELMAQFSELSIDELEQYGNVCANALRRADMYYGDASKEYHDYIVDSDDGVTIDQENFVQIVCSACAGFTIILDRDGYT